MMNQTNGDQTVSYSSRASLPHSISTMYTSQSAPSPPDYMNQNTSYHQDSLAQSSYDEPDSINKSYYSRPSVQSTHVQLSQLTNQNNDQDNSMHNSCMPISHLSQNDVSNYKQIENFCSTEPSSGCKNCGKHSQKKDDLQQQPHQHTHVHSHVGNQYHQQQQHHHHHHNHGNHMHKHQHSHGHSNAGHQHVHKHQHSHNYANSTATHQHSHAHHNHHQHHKHHQHPTSNLSNQTANNIAFNLSLANSFPKFMPNNIPFAQFAPVF